jgi:hypothetical protein
MVSDARAASWESAAVEAIATAESLDGAATLLAQAVIALVKDRREWQRLSDQKVKAEGAGSAPGLFGMAI